MIETNKYAFEKRDKKIEKLDKRIDDVKKLVEDLEIPSQRCYSDKLEDA